MTDNPNQNGRWVLGEWLTDSEIASFTRAAAAPPSGAAMSSHATLDGVGPHQNEYLVAGEYLTPEQVRLLAADAARLPMAILAPPTMAFPQAPRPATLVEDDFYPAKGKDPKAKPPTP